MHPHRPDATKGGGHEHFAIKLPSALAERHVASRLGRHRRVAAQACRDFRVMVRAAEAMGAYEVTVLGIAAGNIHTVIATAEGVCTFGSNGEGQLGHGDYRRVLRPKWVASMPVVAVAAGSLHTVMCTDVGQVFTCGYGMYGQLGHGTHDQNELTPRLVEALVGMKVVAVAAGDTHTAVVTEGGELLTFGDGCLGRLGYRTTQYQLTPKLVEVLVGKKVTAVACGMIETIVCTDAGEVYAFGCGRFGQLGHGTPWSGGTHTPRLVEALVGKKVVAVAAGGAHTAVVTEGGELFTFGVGSHGRLGHGDKQDKLVPTRVLFDGSVVKVACGGNHTVMCTDAGEVFTCGYGRGGCLGHGDEGVHLSFRRVEALVGKKVINVAAGNHCVVATDAGEVLTFGRGSYGCLGHGGTGDEMLPRAVDAEWNGDEWEEDEEEDEDDDY